MSCLQLPESFTLAELEALLPDAPKPAASYIPVVQTGNLLYTSGQLPMHNGQLLYAGQFNDSGNASGSPSPSIAEGQAAARQCVLNALSVVKAHLGSLDRVRRVVKLTGFVSSTSAFTQQHLVMNGASEFLTQAFGHAIGQHARSAVGVAALPLGALVEVEVIFEI